MSIMAITKKLSVKFTGNIQWLPEGVNPDNWYEVIGYEYFTKRNDDNNWIKRINFLVIDDTMEVRFIPSYNCSVLIVDEEKKKS